MLRTASHYTISDRSTLPYTALLCDPLHRLAMLRIGNYTISHSSILLCITLHGFAYCVALLRTKQHYAAALILHCFALHCIVMH
jgi:hypothetical protein